MPDTFDTCDPLDAQALLRSEIKLRILFLLTGGPCSLARIREATGSSSQALIPRLRGLESLLLIEQEKNSYSLTPLGRIVSRKLEDLVATTATIRRHRSYFATHDTGGIPDHLLSGIGTLLPSELVRDKEGEVNQVFLLFQSIIREASSIRGVSSVMSPHMGDAIAERVMAGIPVELIVTPDGAARLREEPYRSAIELLLDIPHFGLWVLHEPAKIGLTVTDTCISLGLFKKGENVYDISNDLYCRAPAAIAWGEEIFRYFREQSDRFLL